MKEKKECLTVLGIKFDESKIEKLMRRCHLAEQKLETIGDI